MSGAEFIRRRSGAQTTEIEQDEAEYPSRQAEKGIEERDEDQGSAIVIGEPFLINFGAGRDTDLRPPPFELKLREEKAEKTGKGATTISANALMARSPEQGHDGN